MIDEKFFLGFPKNYKNLCKIYPPQVKDVIGNDKFPLYKKILTLSQEELEDEFTEKGLDLKEILSPLEYLFNNAYNSEEMRHLIIEAFVFFIHEPVTFLYEQKKIVIGEVKSVLENLKKVEDLKVLDDSNFFDFQNAVRASLGEKTIEPPNPDEDPRIKRMKAKARYRDKVKAKTASKQSLKTMLASICCMGIGITPLNIGQMSYAAIHPLITTYQNKERYDIDVRSLIAGADSKKVHPTYWMEDVNE